MLPAMHWSLALKVGSAAKNGTVIQSRRRASSAYALSRVCTRVTWAGDSAACGSIVGFPWTLPSFHAVTTLLQTKVDSLWPCTFSAISCGERLQGTGCRRSTEDLVLLVARHQPTVGQHSICSCSACSCLWLRPCACTLRRPRRRASRLRKCSARPLSWPW